MSGRPLTDAARPRGVVGTICPSPGRTGPPRHPFPDRLCARPPTNLSREIQPAAPPARAHPRHRLAEVRARIAGVGEDARGWARVVTCAETGDVGAVRQVFVTSTNLIGSGDTFNPSGRVFGSASRKISRLEVMSGGPAGWGGLLA